MTWLLLHEKSGRFVIIFFNLNAFSFLFFLSCLFFLSLIFRNIFDSFSLSFIYFIVILAVYSDNVCDFFLSSSPFFSSYSSSNCLSFYSYSGFLFPSLSPPSLSPSLSLLSPSSALTSFGFLSPSFSSTSSFSKSSPLCPFSLASSPPPLHLHKFSSTKTPPFSPLKWCALSCPPLLDLPWRRLPNRSVLRSF